MRVTITFKSTEGPQQVLAVTLRVDTLDFVEAAQKALSFCETTLTTIPVVSVLIERD